MDTLIIYYSHTGNIKSFVHKIQNLIPSDILEIELEEPYSKDMKEFVKRVKEELQNDIQPPYKKIKLEIYPYKKVVLIVPNWGNTIPPVVKTFLNDYSLKDKTIYPIISHGGNGEAGMLKQIEELTKSRDVKSGLIIYTNEITSEELKNYFDDI